MGKKNSSNELLDKEKSQGNDSKLIFNVMYYPVFRHLKSQLKELLVILECDAHKKVSQDLTEKKQDLIKMSIILKVLTEI